MNLIFSELLFPNIIYDASEDSGLIIRDLSIFDYDDLFGYVDDDDSEPVHSRIYLGALATSDIVVVDDDFQPLFKEDLFRRSLLSFLQDGDLKILNEKVEVSFKNDCYFIINDTKFPFLRQDFDGMPPEEDTAMSRRVNIIEWAPFVKNTPETRKNFPAIIEKSIDSFRKRNNIDDEIKLSPDGLNTILQYLLADSMDNLLPMQIGALEKALLEPVINRTLEKGKREVTGRDIKDYIQEQNDDLESQIILDMAKTEYTLNGFKPKVGTGNYLSVMGSHGSVGLISAGITGKKGEISSNDTNAEMTDQTHNKGIMNVSTWLQNAFGPLHAEVNYSFHMYGGLGGPSSSAVQTYVLMSALGDIPIKQNVFVTGTILDRDGDVGPIGGVYEKVKGAYDFYEKNKGDNEEPCIVLVPKTNVSELVRRMEFDDDLKKAYDEKKLILTYHESIWDGFQTMSGLEREIYEPLIKKGMKKLNRQVAKNEFVNKYLPFMAK
jgi:hypothetical protein